MAGQKVITPGDLKDFCRRALLREGMREEYAGIAAEVLSETDCFGTHSHGTKNLHNYIRKIRCGGMALNAAVETLGEGPGYALLDAHAVIGMVPAYQAMELACRKAADAGIAAVVVRNAAHFGAAGFYAVLAAQKERIGLVFSNVDANMTVPGARGKVIGNNPIAWGVPAAGFPPVFLDIAMSTVASLKVIQARAEGRSIPDTWIIDEEGLPTTDPGRYPDVGAMQPLAAHKGFGLALLVEMLTGILSGGGMMTEVPSWLFKMEEPNNVSHTFIAVDFSKFIEPEEFRKRVDAAVNLLHKAPKATGTERIYYPGEMEWERYHKAYGEGLVLPPDVAEALNGLAKESGLKINWRELAST